MAKASKELGAFYKNQSQKSIKHALEAIKASPISRDVAAVYLYGSCARGEQTGSSDVDLFLELKDGVDLESRHDALLDLKTAVMPRDLDIPEVDLKVYVGGEWRSRPGGYFTNVAKEGIKLW